MPSEELAAGCKLIGTFELLESVFSELPLQALLLSQRVCRTWNETIQSSSMLQRKLYYLPNPNDVDGTPDTLGIVRDGSATERRLVQVNLLHMRYNDNEQLTRDLILPGYGFNDCVSPEGEWSRDWQPTPNIINPLLASLFPTKIFGCEEVDHFEFRINDLRLRDDSSFHRMYLTPDRLTTIIIQLALHPRIDLEYRRDPSYQPIRLLKNCDGLCITRKSGVTIGDVYYAMQRFNQKCNNFMAAHPEQVHNEISERSSHLYFNLVSLKQKGPGEYKTI